MLMIMKIIDKILELICDTQWHSIDEIRKSILLPSDELNEVICFLEKQGFINKEKEKINITDLGKKFLALKN